MSFAFRSLRALQVRFTIFERAVKALPGSYKLWYAYLRERTQLVRGARLDSELVEATNGVFERALVYLHKMPRIWLMWLEFFAPQVRIICRGLIALTYSEYLKQFLIFDTHQINFSRSNISDTLALIPCFTSILKNSVSTLSPHLLSAHLSTFSRRAVPRDAHAPVV